MSVSKTFTDGDDLFNVNAEDDFSLNFLGGNDRLTTYKGITTALMGDGDDRVVIRGGTVTADGEAGNDRFDFLSDNAGVSLDGGIGNDIFFGYSHSISGSIHGDAGDDSFYNFGRIGGRTVTLYGGTGDDLYRLEPGAPAPTIVEYANEGIDTVQVAIGASYTMAANLESLTVSTFATVDASPVLRGNEVNNIIRGGGVAETMYGMDGDDKLLGNGGDDVLWGVNGNDSLSGGDGNDELHGQAGNDILNGQAGDDVMIGGIGDDRYFVDSLTDSVVEGLGEGVDSVSTSLSSYTLTANVENATSTNDGGVQLTGNELDNKLIGAAGNDTLIGDGGNDVLDGRGGDDTMIGGDGDDNYYVDSFGDVIVETGTGGSRDVVRMTLSSYTLPDTVEVGVSYGGTLSGNDSNNELYGFGQLLGYGGNDFISAGDGDEYIDGGTGDDRIIGSFGADELIGRSGADTFAYLNVTDSYAAGGIDVILDFEAGSDKIDLSAIDADATVDGNQAFTVVSGFTGHAGELMIHLPGVDEDYAVIWADVNGDAHADMAILLKWEYDITASDIVL